MHSEKKFLFRKNKIKDMLIVYSINRKCLHTSKPEFHYFLFVTVFPRTRDNPHYVGVNAVITLIENLWLDYYAAHGVKNYVLGEEIYENIQNATVTLMNFIILHGTNNKARIEETGFSCNKTTKVDEPQSAIPDNLRFMVLGEGKFLLKAEIDDYCHTLKGRARLKDSTDANWREGPISQNSTIHFTGYVHNTDVEVQLASSGTAGTSNWSASVFVPVD